MEKASILLPLLLLLHDCFFPPTKSLLLFASICFGAFTPAFSVDLSGPEMRVDELRCEYLKNPVGIESVRPRLQWRLTSTTRGQKQTGYRILVASAPGMLGQDRGDLWDSGKVDSEQTSQMNYAGSALGSRQSCFWKVMAWDKAGKPSQWSSVASWSMGLLLANDWRADWISDPTLADPLHRPLRPIHCFRSELASRPYASKWCVLDLGAAHLFDSVNLLPARPAKLNHDWRTVLFPVRFKIEVANEASFRDARVVSDQTKDDWKAPRTDDVPFKFSATMARYVRLVVTKLARWDGLDYGIALGGMTVGCGNQTLDVKSVSCSDSIESADYSKAFLGKASREVAIAPDSPQVIVTFPDVPASRTVSRVPMLRREFILGEKIQRATLYVSARGFYEFRLNGQRVGDQLLSPGYTDYYKRIPYQTFDVTNLLRPGTNAMGALLGYGWYAGHMNLARLRCIDGFFPQLIAQLEVELANNQRLVLTTDGKWRSTLSGPVLWSDLLDGEGYDCRKEFSGWDKPGFDDHEWKLAWAQPKGDVPLVSPGTPPVQAIQEIAPVQVKEVKPGILVYDFGQEISGYCRLKVDGPSGSRIRIRHAELIGQNGMIDTKNLWGTAAQEDYVLDGQGRRLLEPHFTYHGFRYVELTGMPKASAADALVAVNIRSGLDTVGEFTCSNEAYNRLMTATRWTQWNMLFDVPAGCAGRSERLSWLGDIRPCVQTVNFNMDANAFFLKYMVDIRDGQTAEGRFTDIAPHNHLRDFEGCIGSPGWADAGVSLPWDMYVSLGDRQLLKEHFDSAKRWVDYVRDCNANLLWLKARGQDWGDWLPAGSPSTAKPVGSTAFFAYSTGLVAQMATVLGKTEEAAKYGQLHADIRKAFAKAFVSPEGKIGNDSQGDYVLALQFNLLDEPSRSQAVARLKEAIHRADDHPTIGFWSCALPQVLSEIGEHELAEKLVLQPSRPSWRFIVDNSTTFWESFNADGRKLSLNHWTYSSIGEWLWRNVAGINPDPQQPGYRSVVIHPRPSAEVTSCKASYQSIRGLIEVSWSKEQGSFSMDISVPVGATAEVYLPAAAPTGVTESGRPAASVEGVKFLRQEKDRIVFRVESGKYQFRSEYDPIRLCHL